MNDLVLVGFPFVAAVLLGVLAALVTLHLVYRLYLWLKRQFEKKTR